MIVFYNNLQWSKICKKKNIGHYARLGDIIGMS